ncbi:MAG TPA: hypothetical protein VFZ12_00010 [Dehalococcoidia bacterium]|jgi:hypothetical protein|nr:hypothetical protein [Dehalococcoidia bacterium]
MSVARTVAEILAERVTLEIEGIDRLYLNVYVPALQHDGGVVQFFRGHRGQPIASSALMAPISRTFVEAIERFVAEQDVPLITFQKGQRKDDVAKEHLARFARAGHEEGMLFVGKAQEKAPVYRTEKRRTPDGRAYPWLVRSTALVNHYYFYGVDRDFGPFFLKLCSYFPYTAKLCVNGHEYLKRQLAHEGIAFEALDNGLLTCADPARAQAICDGLGAERIDALLRKWLDRLPQPFTLEDRQAGYRYEISILQAEFSLTQVLDRPLTGRVFFEEVIREHLDLGRPDQVQLIFDRRVTRRTPGRFRTRVITEGVIPSLHVDYKRSRIKQYHKEGRALRTETTINNPRDFGIGKRLTNLPALRQVGFGANRRLLSVQRVSHDCQLGEAAFAQITRPIEVDGQRAAALRFEQERVQALLSALVVFSLLPTGFSNRDLREQLAPLLGLAPSQLPPGRMTYDLRRLRLHGLIERLPRTHRYRLTQDGLHAALFFTRTYTRLFRPGLAQVIPVISPPNSPLRAAFDQLDRAIDRWCLTNKLVA